MRPVPCRMACSSKKIHRKKAYTAHGPWGLQYNDMEYLKAGALRSGKSHRLVYPTTTGYCG